MPPAILIAGGGIIGCATAYELAKGGCRVTVLERDTAHFMTQCMLTGRAPALPGPFLPDRFISSTP